MSKSTKLFIFLSLTIGLIDGLFVTMNHFYTKQSFTSTLQEESQNYYAIYETVLESTYNGLSMQAILYAGDKRIQHLFLQGKKALALEGGGAGGVETARVRNELNQLMAQAWQEAIQKFDVRQLHFHLGPGSLSFLRVHKPQKFGDRMDDLRFIIVDTNAEQTPHSGFETGRIYSGLRSVVPVFAWDQDINRKVYVGALEVGTSYKRLLQTIDKNLNIELSILLNNEHIKNTVWDEFITGRYNNNSISGCDCILEASSRPNQEPLLEHIAKKLNSEQQLAHPDEQARVVSYNDHYYSVTFHPLRDYMGQKDPSRHTIGAVFIARDITDTMAVYLEEQRFNILYGFIAYIIVELLLILTFYKITKHLTFRVKKQTAKLSEQKRVIELDKAKYKNLANAINSRYFYYIRHKDKQLSYVSPSINEVLGFTPAEFLSNTEQYLPDNAHTDFVREKARQSFLGKNQNSFEVEIYNKSGRLQYLLVTETPKYNDNEEVTQIEGLAQDISQTRQDKMLLQLRCHILQMISDKCAAKTILTALVVGTKAIIQDISCAIMLVNKETNRLEIGATADLDKNFRKALSELDVSSEIGCCGIAAATAKRKIIVDLQQHPSLKNLHDIPYKSCWSEPVLSAEARVIATVNIYYNDTHTPNESDLLIISTIVDLVASLLNG